MARKGNVLIITPMHNLTRNEIKLRQQDALLQVNNLKFWEPDIDTYNDYGRPQDKLTKTDEFDWLAELVSLLKTHKFIYLAKDWQHDNVCLCMYHIAGVMDKSIIYVDSDDIF